LRGGQVAYSYAYITSLMHQFRGEKKATDNERVIFSIKVGHGEEEKGTGTTGSFLLPFRKGKKRTLQESGGGLLTFNLISKRGLLLEEKGRAYRGKNEFTHLPPRKGRYSEGKFPREKKKGRSRKRERKGKR